MSIKIISQIQGFVVRREILISQTNMVGQKNIKLYGKVKPEVEINSSTCVTVLVFFLPTFLLAFSFPSTSPVSLPKPLPSY